MKCIRDTSVSTRRVQQSAHSGWYERDRRYPKSRPSVPLCATVSTSKRDRRYLAICAAVENRAAMQATSNAWRRDRRYLSVRPSVPLACAAGFRTAADVFAATASTSAPMTTQSPSMRARRCAGGQLAAAPRRRRGPCRDPAGARGRARSGAERGAGVEDPRTRDATLEVASQGRSAAGMVLAIA